MINERFFVGKPERFRDICKVYPPTLNDIMDNEQYPYYKSLLTISGEDIEDQFAEQKIDFHDLPSPLQYLVAMTASDEHIKDLVSRGFEFFIHEPVTILADLSMIIVGDLATTLQSVSSVEELRIIKEDNFFDFQNLLRQAVGEKTIEPYNPDENPKIKYFKAKARLRDRVKAKSADSLTFGTTLAAICCMDFGINPLNVGELSQCAVNVLTRYYQEKTKYDIDIRSLLAGADSKKVKPKNWIRNLEDL